MLQGLRGGVRGVRFRSNRREIAFFAPARVSRLPSCCYELSGPSRVARPALGALAVHWGQAIGNRQGTPTGDRQLGTPSVSSCAGSRAVRTGRKGFLDEYSNSECRRLGVRERPGILLGERFADSDATEQRHAGFVPQRHSGGDSGSLAHGHGGDCHACGGMGSPRCTVTAPGDEQVLDLLRDQ